MTNHPKFTRSHDSAAHSVGYEGARESQLENSGATLREYTVEELIAIARNEFPSNCESLILDILERMNSKEIRKD